MENAGGLASHDTVRFRGGYQVATRAPNTAELFQGQSLLVVGFAPSDPCSFTTTGAVGQRRRQCESRGGAEPVSGHHLPGAQTFTSAFDTNAAGPNGFARPGNPFFPLEIELQQRQRERRLRGSENLDGGARFHARASGNITGSFDIYNIEIENAIAPLNSLFVYGKCFNADGVSNPTLTYNDPGGYCRLIGRNTVTGERATVDSPFSNAGVLETTGVDFTVNWIKDIGGDASFYVNSLLSVLNRFEVQDAPGEAVIDLKDTLAGFGSSGGGQYDFKLTYDVWLQLRRRQIQPRTCSGGTCRAFATRGGAQSCDEVPRRRFVLELQLVRELHVNERFDCARHRQPARRGAVDRRHSPGDGRGNAEVTRADYYDTLGRRAYVGIR